MKRIRITGLVNLANHIRQEISRPISSERLTQLRENTSRSIETVNRVLNDVSVHLDALPAPSRRAYEFLAGIDFNSVETDETCLSLDYVPNSVSFPGLKSHLTSLLDRIAQGPEDSQVRQMYSSIQESSGNIERQIRTESIKPEQLKSQSRLIRGWLAYFVRRENFYDYLAAVRRAKPMFHGALPEARKRLRPVLIHFRPMQGIRPCSLVQERDSNTTAYPDDLFWQRYLSVAGRADFSKDPQQATGTGCYAQRVLSANTLKVRFP